MLDKNPGQRHSHEGWQQVSFLEKEGTRDEILARLSTALDASYRDGKYSAGLYGQAGGGKPHSLETGTRPQDGGSRQPHGDGPGISEIYSEHYSLKDELMEMVSVRAHIPIEQTLQAIFVSLR
jgi:hypothetical protein